jgi:hypothetical protein
VSRRLLVAALLAALRGFAVVPGLSIRGKLVQTPDKKPALELTGRKLIQLEGDEPTLGVLNDKRLAGMDLEAIGHFNSPDRFEVDPIHTKALFVHKDGKKLSISYWCDVCYIRTYSPGICVCCQKYTDLDLRASDVP